MLAGLSCVKPAADVRAAEGWSYDVDVLADASPTIVVEATFDNARTDRLTFARAVAMNHPVERKTADGWVPVQMRGSQWIEPGCQRRCTVRYRIDLTELAAQCGGNLDCARVVDGAVLSPAMAWLMYPAPKVDAPVSVHVRTEPGATFATGMHATDASERNFSFRSHDLDEGSFSAFGQMRHAAVQLPGRGGQSSAVVNVEVLGRQTYAMTDDDVRTWVHDASNVVIPLFGRFPVERTTLFVVPAKDDRDVVFGKVLSLAGASIALVVGDRMPPEARHRDWVLVHELFHLGFPTFRGEGRWLGEGLATYYEPILRARAGWTTEPDIYKQFVRNMPRGLAANATATGLAQRADLDSIYWGGALFCWAADVRIREETAGTRSLDDVLRAAVARGADATHVWTVADVVKLGDEVTGTRVLSDMVERYVTRGERIEFERLVASLGIVRDDGGVALDEYQPRSWIRRQIVGRSAGKLASTVGLR